MKWKKNYDDEEKKGLTEMRINKLVAEIFSRKIAESIRSVVRYENIWASSRNACETVLVAAQYIHRM